MTVAASAVEPPAPAASPARPAGPALRRWVDQFLGSDPGLNRFRMALQAVISIAAILGAENLFVRYTHALQIQVPAGIPLPPAKAAMIALANHEFLVIAIMLGAMIGMMSSFGVADPTAKGQLISMLLLPWPMLAAMALGIEIGPYRIAALVSFPVILAIGTYFRRFGPRGFMMGMLLFMGDFMGFFMHAALKIGDIGWIAAEIGVGVVVAMIIRFVFFYPRQSKALQRTQRSYSARARKVGAVALALFDDPAHTDRDARRLQRQLTRLNEAALMIDAQLGDPGAVAEGSSGELLHQRLFDAELALTNMARFARAATKLDLPDDCRAEIRGALRGIVAGDAGAARSHAQALAGLARSGDTGAGEDRDGRATVIILRRLAGSVTSLCDSLTDWMSLGRTSEGGDTFQPAVMLMAGGFLPGSAMVSMSASSERAVRFGMPPYIRAAIQIGIAVGAAVALGDVVSGHRFYWAVIAAFITFMGANTSGEQVRKAVYRVAGTAIGIVVGSLMVHVVGHHTGWSIVVILVALFFGFYLFRINYAFMVIGITVMVSQLYVQLDEFSDSMLVLRLEETALGAAIAAIVVLCVLPLKTRHVLRVAFTEYLQALREMTGHAAGRLLGSDAAGAGTSLRADARAVDAAFQAVIATAQPLRRSYFGDLDEQTSAAVRMAAASRHYCRSLVADTESAGPLDTGTRLDIKRSATTLDESLETIETALTGPRDGTYTRSSALFEQAERRLEGHAGPATPAQLAIRDLKLVDGSMAELAKILGLSVASYDTDFAQTQSEGGIGVHGRVVNAAGASVGRAALTLIDGGGRQVAVGVSDYDGDYQLYAPPGDATYSLIVSAESHVPSVTTVVVRHMAGTGLQRDIRLESDTPAVR